MLICIDASGIEDAAGDGPGAQLSLHAIEHLLRAHGSGKHMISTPREAKRALKHKGLSSFALATLDRVIADRSQIEALRKDIDAHLVAGVGESFERIAQGADERALRVHLHHFEDFERAARSVLLGEDKNDAELFEMLGRAWLARRGWQMKLAYDLRPGGGSSIADAFEEAARDGRILFAIADSDVTFPDGPCGQTWLHLRRAAEGRPLFQRAEALPVRAAENLIPLELYEHALAPHLPDERGHVAIRRLDELRQRPSPRAWQSHADLKEGLKLRKVEEMGDTSQGRFWGDVAARAGRGSCARERACDDLADCACFVVDGLGARALERAVVWMKKQPPRRLANLFAFEEAPPIAALAARIVAWGIASTRRAT